MARSLLPVALLPVALLPVALVPVALVQVAGRLADVLERENAALRAMDLVRAARLLPEKTAAIAELAAFGETAVPPPNPALTAAARRLDALTRENRQLLRRAIAAQQRVIGIIVRAAAGAVADPSYGTRGRRPRWTAAMALSTRA
jgi:hypothetical protein